MIWFALLIPLIVSIGAYILYKKKIVWWEIALCTIISTLYIVIAAFIIEQVSLSDTEYKSYLITEARYYESYETWNINTCTREVKTGTDKDGKPVYKKETYDCSYCKRYPEEYKLYDSGGNEFEIDRAEYMRYVKLWKKEPKFAELNRAIKYNDTPKCGKDGDMYYVKWDGDQYTSVSSTFSHGYKNKLQTNNSAFNFKEISKKQAGELGLYDYPLVIDYYQDAVMGLDNLDINILQKDSIIKTIDCVNGIFSKRFEVKVYLFVFRDSEQDIALQQESYWQGGNRNEICICIGTDSAGNINWVYPFSWVKEKVMLVNLREDIATMKNITNTQDLYSTLKDNIYKHWKPRDIEKDFEYLSFEFKTWQIVLIYLMTVLVSVLVMYFAVKNKYENK